MDEALDRADFEAVRILGNCLWGSGGGFGLQAITDIGAGLEQAAEGADTDASRKWVGKLSSYLDRVELNSGYPAASSAFSLRLRRLESCS